MKISELKDLKDLLDDGIITQKEFELKKKEFLGTQSMTNKKNKNIFEWYGEAFTKYADFTGRASRSEYWSFFLVNIIISLIAYTVDLSLEIAIFSVLYSLICLLPSLSLLVRRLHDTNNSGFLSLIAFIPLVGSIALLILLLQDSQEGENRYGTSPKD